MYGFFYKTIPCAIEQLCLINRCDLRLFEAASLLCLSDNIFFVIREIIEFDQCFDDIIVIHDVELSLKVLCDLLKQRDIVDAVETGYTDYGRIIQTKDCFVCSEINI